MINKQNNRNHSTFIEHSLNNGTLTRRRNRRIPILAGTVSLALLLSGCGSTQELQTKKVEEYNAMATGTVNSYSDIVNKITEEQVKLENYLIFDSKYPLAEDAKYNLVTPLSERELENFNDYNSVIDNDYYTSLGANTVRQVLVVKGQKQIMYATIVWKKDKIISIERVIKNG